MLPFTREQFFGIFVEYNEQVWPVQVAAYLLGMCLVALLFRPFRSASRVIAGGLAAMWIWTGIAYHAVHFSAINRAAYAFAALFVLQAVLLLYLGAARNRLRFDARVGRSRTLAWALIGYAMLIYPLIGLWSGHRLSELPMFGITPCPVTLFTLGLLLLATPPVPRWLLIVPIVWSLIGGSAAVLLGVPQDWPLLFSGVATALTLRSRRGGSIPNQAHTPVG
jgi:hypothetical protein